MADSHHSVDRLEAFYDAFGEGDAVRAFAVGLRGKSYPRDQRTFGFKSEIRLKELEKRPAEQSRPDQKSDRERHLNNH